MRLGALGRRRQDARRRGGREIGPVVLADAEHIEADLVGQLDLFDQVAQPLRRVDGLPGRRIGRGFRECVDADFHAGPFGRGGAGRGRSLKDQCQRPRTGAAHPAR